MGLPRDPSTASRQPSRAGDPPPTVNDRRAYRDLPFLALAVPQIRGQVREQPRRKPEHGRAYSGVPHHDGQPLAECPGHGQEESGEADRHAQEVHEHGRSLADRHERSLAVAR